MSESQPAKTTSLPDPLPRHFVTDPDWAVPGTIKQRTEDFLVDEIPAYEPCGEGEHLYLRVQKDGVSHGELMSTLRRAFNVRNVAIGYAGMKDKRGITQQTVSIHLPGKHDIPEPIELGHDRIIVLWSARHTNKIQRGHLKGNRFLIRLRGVEPTHVIRVKRTMQRLEACGVPNFFGGQRFGYRQNNHLVGAAILREDWDSVIREVLGHGQTSWPEHQNERRDLFEAGQYEEAARHWPTADRNEMMMIRRLAAGGNAKYAVTSVGKPALSFWTNAFQSAIFNRVLDDRIADGTFDQLLEGDLAWKHDSRAVFPVTAEELATGELDERLQRIEISPSGPLWGSGMTLTDGVVGEHEARALAETGFDVESYRRIRNAPTGSRRSFRIRVSDWNLDSGVDEHGSYIRLAFDLTRGGYATMVIREVTHTDDPQQMR
ncbi:MAG: tRNA pseudouridine(13) synthase TruD [Planctomycetota bacterium]